MGQEADGIAATIVLVIGTFAKQTKLGFVNGSQGGYRIFDDPQKVRVPDVSFTRWERFGGQRPARGHSTTVPDLVVEVISPSDDAETLWARIEDFLSAGVPMIWVVDPGARTLEVLRSDRTAVRLRADDEIDGAEILPGFRCKVADLFNLD